MTTLDTKYHKHHLSRKYILNFIYMLNIIFNTILSEH